MYYIFHKFLEHWFFCLTSISFCSFLGTALITFHRSGHEIQGALIWGTSAWHMLQAGPIRTYCGDWHRYMVKHVLLKWKHKEHLSLEFLGNSFTTTWTGSDIEWANKEKSADRWVGNFTVFLTVFKSLDLGLLENYSSTFHIYKPNNYFLLFE